jgi:hypothetical protein
MMTRYVIPKRINVGDVVEICGEKVKVVELQIKKKLGMTSNMPYYKIIYQDTNQNIKDVVLPSHTIIKKFIITEKKKKGLRSD